MRLKVVFVEQFYYPQGWGGAEIPTDLTMHLARRGFDVEVICGSDLYAPLDGPTGEDPRSAGVRIRRVPALFGGDIRALKLVRQLWFYVSIVPLMLLRRRPALFILQTNPPLGVVLGAVAARIWRRPLVIIAMDLYPEVIIAHGALRGSSWFAALLRAVFRWAYRTASRVVVLGPVMAERLVSKGVAPTRLVEIQNWSTGTPGVVRGAANRLLSEWGLQGRFVLCYSGNLGVGHEFDTLLEGFALAAHSLPELFLVIVGKGSRLAEVRAKVAALDIARNVRFEGFLPANRLPESIGLADLAVVTMRPGFEGLIVPSKLYGCMSRGVPVLYIGPRSDTEVSIQRYSCGVTVRNHDVQAVARVVAELYADRGRLESLGEAGRRWYATELDRPMALARYEAVVRSCVDSH